MVRIRKKKEVEKLKKQDKELAKLPSLAKEKKRFKKGESVLERWSKKQAIESDVFKLARSRKPLLKKKAKKKKKPKKARKKR